MTAVGYYLGFDTSNYTTSVACYCPEESTIRHSKRLLPVPAGQLGLRQSDALFHHVRQLPEVLSQALAQAEGAPVAVCASERPRNLPDSYMPCFLAGATTAKAVAATHRVPYYPTAHQDGHLAAALYASGRLDLADRPFLAFHVSGGTMELLHITPHWEQVFSVTVLGQTLDISAGQLIDRVGIRLGLPFPAGAHLEALAQDSTREEFRRILLRDGDCSLSGMENLLEKMLADGAAPADAARFLLLSLADLLDRMTRYALERQGPLPVVYSGGVMSNRLLRSRLQQGAWESIFAPPEFSADNAAGVAVLGCLMDQRQKGGGA